jgi:hypothetical protein
MSEERKKLRPRCGDSRCEDNLHCYHQAQRRARQAHRSRGSTAGQSDVSLSCRACGAHLVDWERVRRRELTDVFHTFEQLKTELIRHYEFHAPIHPHAVNYARRKGRVRLRAKVADHLRKALGPAVPYHDGWQTRYPNADRPVGSDIIYAAQHATACCCRKCAETWHGIPQGRDLREDEVLYLADLAMRFIDERLPELADHPINVAPIRRDQGSVRRDT